jgi:diaminopimelate epimerase
VIPYSKWDALGNSYLVVDRGEAGRPLDADDARRLCAVGADGVLEVTAVEGPQADVLVWNPDGSHAEFSGNGARIAAAWLAARVRADEVTVRFGSRETRAHVAAGDVDLDVGRVEVRDSERLDVAGEELEVTPASVGNPHAVVRRDFQPGEIERLGPALEHHPRFHGRTNVQLVRVAGPHEIEIAIWERGVGVTSASGSSAVAAAAVAVARAWCETPVAVRVPGGVLHVELEGGHARLRGPVERLEDGEVPG